MADEIDSAAPSAPKLERRISDITSDISLDNLLEGSRRKRNKFSSDLPLVPLPLPTPPNAQYPTGYARSYSGARDRAGSGSTFGNAIQTPGRVSIPTPAPTTISDEDVAIQLIRLGDPSLSPCKAPSDDSSSPIPNLTTAMQLKALYDDREPGRLGVRSESVREVDYPSSPPASIDDSQEQHNSDSSASSLLKMEPEEAVKDIDARILRDTEEQLKDETDIEDEIDIPRPQNLPHFHDSVQCNTRVAGTFGAEEDRNKKSGPSIGIRCTRCKKSKKGCDRQRPCGRCADANEDCVTEDESSGRRGRNHRGGRKRR